MATLGPGDGSIKVYTKREGLASRVGHDLTLEASRWNAEVTVDPDDITRSSVSATVDGGSFEVQANVALGFRSGLGGFCDSVITGGVASIVNRNWSELPLLSWTTKRYLPSGWAG